MPLHHHGGTPHTKRQQHKKSGKDTGIVVHSAGIEREIHTEPFNHGRWEQAVHTHTAGHAPAPTTGGPLSIGEGAARLAVIGSDQGASGAFQSAMQAMNEQILGTLMNVVQGLPSDVNGAVQALGTAPEAGEIQGAGEHAAGAAEDAIELVQQAIAGIQQAAEHERVFRQAVQAAAQRYGG